MDISTQLLKFGNAGVLLFFVGFLGKLPAAVAFTGLALAGLGYVAAVIAFFSGR